MAIIKTVEFTDLPFYEPKSCDGCGRGGATFLLKTAAMALRFCLNCTISLQSQIVAETVKLPITNIGSASS